MLEPLPSLFKTSISNFSLRRLLIMWTLRRASLRLRNQGFNAGASRASTVNFVPTMCVENEVAIQYHQVTCGGFLSSSASYDAGHAYLKYAFSSQAGASSTREDNDDLEDSLSELDTHETDNESEADLPDSDEYDSGKPHDELGLSDPEIDPPEKLEGRKVRSELFQAILKAPGFSVHSALDKWVKEGKTLNRSDISMALANLRRRNMYSRALQVFEWLESNKKLEFVEKDYASRLDLIAKLHGLYKAEKYIERVPNSFRGELLYRTLLANCASQGNLKKTEETFNKMKDLGLPVTAFACNQLLLMFKKVDKKRIADVLLLMEKENVKPSSFTYKILIDAKGHSNDIAGMEQVVETMNAEGVEPDIKVKAALVRHYISAGHKEKAETVLKEIEGENLKENLWVCSTLMSLYANMGSTEEVERIWKACKSKPRMSDCLAAVEAWGKLNKIEEAEAISEMMSKKWKLSSKHYAVLLKIYVNNKMLKKAKELIKRMADSGCRIGPLTWDALVRLYLQEGKLEKADSVMQNALENKRMKPLFTTYMAILEQYAKKGDVHNSEKVFQRMRQAGYSSRISQFEVLLQAYINAKLPAYGIKERMKADSLFPNKAVAGQLVLVDPFRKTQYSELLD
ncbi:hypothetical protein RJT34_24359 [Clitoria ternatea]|uniref:PROP1-like PPR domain-containing protein n=1 Tax=Clitoria ternatea TaxID=43366 RepID=A0AAN9IL85_CLITE